MQRLDSSSLLAGILSVGINSTTGEMEQSRAQIFVALHSAGLPSVVPPCSDAGKTLRLSEEDCAEL
jgi:hypothetical protein